jgi:hypothetical protein
MRISRTRKRLQGQMPKKRVRSGYCEGERKLHHDEAVSCPLDLCSCETLLHPFPAGWGPELTAITFNPGLMPGTGLTRASSAIGNFLWHKAMPHILPLLRLLLGSKNIHTQAESGKNMAFLVLGEGDMKGTNGVYFENHGEKRKISQSVRNSDCTNGCLIKRSSEGASDLAK